MVEGGSGFLIFSGENENNEKGCWGPQMIPFKGEAQGAILPGLPQASDPGGSHHNNPDASNALRSPGSLPLSTMWL